MVKTEGREELNLSILVTRSHRAALWPSLQQGKGAPAGSTTADLCEWNGWTGHMSLLKSFATSFPALQPAGKPPLTSWGLKWIKVPVIARGGKLIGSSLDAKVSPYTSDENLAVRSSDTINVGGHQWCRQYAFMTSLVSSCNCYILLSGLASQYAKILPNLELLWSWRGLPNSFSSAK